MSFDYNKQERPEESFLGEFITWYCTNCNAHDEDTKRPKKCLFCGCTDLNYGDIPHWDDIRPVKTHIAPEGSKPFVKWVRR